VQRDRGYEALIGDELLVAEVEALEPAGAESALKAAELGERLLRGEERVAGGLAGVEVWLAGREAEGGCGGEGVLGVGDGGGEAVHELVAVRVVGGS